MDTILPIIITLAIAAFLIWFIFVLPYKMARKRNRSATVWVLVSVLVSPIIAVVVLAAMGMVENKTDIAETFA